MKSCRCLLLPVVFMFSTLYAYPQNGGNFHYNTKTADEIEREKPEPHLSAEYKLSECNSPWNNKEARLSYFYAGSLNGEYISNQKRKSGSGTVTIFSGYDALQPIPAVKKNIAHPLSRYRLSFGVINLYPEENNLDFRHYFLNLSYRSSGFKRDSGSFSVKFAFEPGINGLIISNGYKNTYEFYLIPYAKFGPEVKLSKNLFLGVSAGLILTVYDSGLFSIPFYGANGFYLFDLSDNLSLELETGFHSAISFVGFAMLGYFTVGISLR